MRASPPSSSPTSTATAPWAASICARPWTLAFALHTPVIASGGVSTLHDLEEIRGESDSGIAGVICGRAIYDGRIDPAEALNLFKAAA